MKDKPILFSGAMVRAILREIEKPGTGKTQTRRVVKFKVSSDCERIIKRSDFWGEDCTMPERYQQQYRHDGKWLSKAWTEDPCPYGRAGDLLWVRETFWHYGRWVKNGMTKTGRQKWKFKPEPHSNPVKFDPQLAIDREKSGYHKRPSIFLERIYSRLTLEITDIRVERLKDISTDDIAAEGIKIPKGTIYSDRARDRFQTLWDSINAGRDLGWQENPWVWAVTFRPHLINVQEVIDAKQRGIALKDLIAQRGA